MEYRCIKELWLDRYDEDGFLVENKPFIVPVGSIWRVQESDLFSILGNDDNIHLDRIWKSKKAKTRPWIEISKEHLSTHFEPYKTESEG